MNEVVTQTTALDTIVKESGLEKSKAELVLAHFNDAFRTAAEWEQKAKTIKVTSVTQANEMRMAREGRLLLKEKRVSVEKKRKELKEQSLREGKAIDGIANVLKGLIEPIEQYLEEQEKFIEVQEEKRKSELKAVRLKEVEGLIADTSMYDFGNMPEEHYRQLIEGIKLIRAKEEEERTAKIKAENEERDRMRLENERLRKEVEQRERVATAEREKFKAEQMAQLEKSRKEREAIEAKAKAERLAQEEKLRKERAEREKVEAELRAKQEAEARAKKEKALAERKAKAAPDAEKAKAYIDATYSVQCPKFSDDDVIAIVGDFNDALDAAVVKAQTQLGELK